MSFEDQRQISPEWLARVQGATGDDPWIHGFEMFRSQDMEKVGQCGFVGPPERGVVEIAYAVDPAYRGRGYATEAAKALVEFAFADPRVKTIRAHTLPQENASSRVLLRCGFGRAGEAIDPEAGRVWRWELQRKSDSP